MTKQEYKSLPDSPGVWWEEDCALPYVIDKFHNGVAWFDWLDEACPKGNWIKLNKEELEWPEKPAVSDEPPPVWHWVYGTCGDLRPSWHQVETLGRYLGIIRLAENTHQDMDQARQWIQEEIERRKS